MSQSLAAFRKHSSSDFAALADQHIQHDLTATDRTALQSAAKKVSTYASIGSVLGLSLGLFLSLRLRANRTRYFEAFKAAQRPTHVKFADGREEAIPDIAPLLKPTPLGDVMTYTFFSIAGIFLGGEMGLLTGSMAARSTIFSDPEGRARIEKAFKGFRADMLRKEADALEKGEMGMGSMGF